MNYGIIFPDIQTDNQCNNGLLTVAYVISLIQKIKPEKKLFWFPEKPKKEKIWRLEMFWCHSTCKKSKKSQVSDFFFHQKKRHFWWNVITR